MTTKNRFIILDGATGTIMQKRGLLKDGHPEIIAITQTEAAIQIHRDYIEAGADIIYANTFGANEFKLSGTGYRIEQIVRAGIAAAKKAAEGTDVKVALDIGPMGELMEPSGTLTFERAYDNFARIAKAGELAGADLAVVETMTDIYEVKAAVLALKENTSLPVIVSMTFEEGGRTFTGCSVESMAALLNGLGADAAGINCSLGPDEILPIAKRLCAASDIPVFVKPNAGLPDPATGEYMIGPEEFAKSLLAYEKTGVSMIGGCCGTSPDFIRAVKNAFEGKVPAPIEKTKDSIVTTATNVTKAEGVTVIGERINPTGKKAMKEALKEGNMAYILNQAIAQADAGAEILDVNVGTPGIDEKTVLPEVVKEIQHVTSLPLQLDSSDPEALDAALRVYNGKPVVNSVNGDMEVLDTILPLVKKYGAAVVGLTLDKDGIPETAEGRFEIAQRILEAARSYGIPDKDVYIDCLTLTASAQQEGAEETLKALSMVKERLGLKTVLGVSNISFGLPNRELMNHSFLLMAMHSGLDFPIINPNTESMMDAVRAYRVLANIDRNSEEYIAEYKDKVIVKKESVKADKDSAPASSKKDEHPLVKAVKDGFEEEAAELTAEMLKDHDAMEIINGYLIPALDIVGSEFETGKLFLPQLLQAASAVQKAFEVVKKQLAESSGETIEKGTVVIATVEDDIHDIGKNIVRVILENYGYRVIDLGRDVPADKIAETVKKENAHLLGLSALMTTTLKSMEKTIAKVRETGCDCRIMVGGAVLTEEYSMEIGADYYAKDAKRSADIAKEVIG